MADFQYTAFPIDADEIDIDQLQTDIQNVTADIVNINTAIDSINTRLNALLSRSVNGETLNANIILKSANFSESITGEKMMASFTYTQVSSW